MNLHKNPQSNDKISKTIAMIFSGWIYTDIYLLMQRFVVVFCNSRHIVTDYRYFYLSKHFSSFHLYNDYVGKSLVYSK